MVKVIKMDMTVKTMFRDKKGKRRNRRIKSSQLMKSSFTQ